MYTSVNYYNWVFLVFRNMGFPTNPDGSWRFQCKSCFKFYKQRSGLYNHTKYDCGKEPSFPCLYCPYKAKHKANLKIHLSRKHRAELITKSIHTAWGNQGLISITLVLGWVWEINYCYTFRYIVVMFRQWKMNES